MAVQTPKEIMKVITRECRDLLELIVDKAFDVKAATPEERNDFIKEHFAIDLSGYGIPVEEYIEGLSAEDRIEVVNKTLALPEYTS